MHFEKASNYRSWRTLSFCFICSTIDEIMAGFKIIDLNFTNQNEKIIGYKVYPIEKVNEYIKEN